MKHLISILSIALSLTSLASAQSWSAHSVLASGSWFKLAIPSEGIYRISAADISALNGCSVDNIAIFGQPGGMLTENNWESRPDDLQQMAIHVHDANANGIFNTDDYILFYAQGPDSWEYLPSDKSFLHRSNNYSNYNYCYLTTSASNGKRISSSNISPTSPDAISIYSSRAYHEKDLANPEQSGRLWMGEIFASPGQSKSFSLALPNRVLPTVKLHYGMVSLSAGNGRFDIASGASSSSFSLSSRIYGEGSSSISAPTSGHLNLDLTYHANASGDRAYLDYISATATSPLSFNGGQLDFRSVDHLNDGLNHSFIIAQATASMQVWDVTDFHNVSSMNLSRSGTSASFAAATSSLREFIAFDSSFLSPASISSLPNQDLHALHDIDYVIVSNPRFVSYAQDILDDHLSSGLSGIVLTDEQVFNEFSSGRQDPMAIRELMRMLYFRAGDDPSAIAPRYLLLFGKGTYDPKDIEGNNFPIVITGQSLCSFGDNGISYPSDDVFGYLDNAHSFVSSYGPDIAVGRIPARSDQEARIYADKHRRYMQSADLGMSAIRGDWRNYVTLLADDADPSLIGDTSFVSTCEELADRISSHYPHLNIDKIYADSYHQQSGAIGSYYPDANNALKTRLDYGTILLNYVGHGSIEYIGTEKYMTKTDIAGYRNTNQLAFFVTSTCSFGRFDKTNVISGAESFLFADGGGIGVISAARPIQNFQHFNAEVCDLALSPDLAVGDALRLAKSRHSVSHCITLFGDPALHLSIPSNKVRVTSINSRPVQTGIADTAVVLSTITVEGEITDPEGSRLTDFNGILYSTVFDRVTRTSTLANDNEGSNVSFSQQKNILYRGSDSVHNGTFSYQFIVPRDVPYSFDFGKLSHFAKSTSTTATGSYNNILFGGFNDTIDLSVIRPDIRLFMNDSSFRSGGITNNNPSIFAILSDKVGINSVGSGLGHDITAIIDDNYNEILTLNDYYETDINDNHKGYLRYYLSDLEPGLHTLTLKAWNIYNYSNSATISFLVRTPGDSPKDDMIINISPNPSPDRAFIRVEHNIQGSIAEATIEIFDMCGRHIRSFSPSIVDHSSVVGPVLWDFTTEAGNPVPNGVFLVRSIILTTDGQKVVKKSKIVHTAQ